MTHTFDDIDLDLGFVDATYHDHRLGLNDFESTGFAAAAWLATAIVASEEGDQRGVVRLNTPEEQQELMLRYEDETYREDGGLLRDEAQALYIWMKKIDETEDLLGALFFSCRQRDLWMELCRNYMQMLVERELKQEVGSIIPMTDLSNFTEWLMVKQARWTKMLMIRRINWLNLDSLQAFVAQVENDPNYLESGVPQSDLITHIEPGKKEQEIFDEYYECRRMEHSTRAERPSDKEWLAIEQTPVFSEEDMAGFSPVQMQELAAWQDRWLRYLYRRLGMTYRQSVDIWTENATMQDRERLEQYLREKSTDDNWCTAMVGALKVMQQKGLIRHQLRASDMAHYCDTLLGTNDYTRGSRRTQFSRKWTEISATALRGIEKIAAKESDQLYE